MRTLPFSQELMQRPSGQNFRAARFFVESGPPPAWLAAAPDPLPPVTRRLQIQEEANQRQTENKAIIGFVS